MIWRDKIAVKLLFNTLYLGGNFVHILNSYTEIYFIFSEVVLRHRTFGVLKRKYFIANIVGKWKHFLDMLRLEYVTYASDFCFICFEGTSLSMNESFSVHLCK